MKIYLNRIAALLGYVPAPAKLAPVGIAIKLDLDSASLDTAIEKLERLTATAERAEAAINAALEASVGEFACAELVADETPTAILAELQKLTTLVEVLAKQGDNAALRTAPATGAAASGLPG